MGQVDTPLRRGFAPPPPPSPPVDSDVQEDSDEDSDDGSDDGSDDATAWLRSRLPSAVMENRRKILVMMDRYDRLKRYNRRYRVEVIEHLMQHVHDPGYYKEEMQFGSILRFMIELGAPWLRDDFGVNVVPRVL